MTEQQLTTLVWVVALTFVPACTFSLGFLLGWIVGKSNNIRMR